MGAVKSIRVNEEEKKGNAGDIQLCIEDIINCYMSYLFS
jgi:hypothetical protein